MRTSFRFFRLIPVLTLALLLSCGRTGESKEEPKATLEPTKPKAEMVDSVPLILLGSFLNNQSAISLDELKTGLASGRVKTTADIPLETKRLLGLVNSPKTVSLQEFVQSRDSGFIITTIDSVSDLLLSVAVDSIDFFRNPEAYPLWLKNASHPFSFGNDITTYTHTGVTAITRQTGVVLDRIGVDAYLANIIGYFQKPELLHMSNEVSRVDDCSYPTMKMQFATKSAHFDILKKLGADIVELTGNHNLDFGKEPYLQTLDWYKKNNMRYFGAGTDISEASKPLVLNMKDGSGMAWIGYNEVCPLGECAGKGPGARRYDKTLAGRTIDSLRESAGIRYIIACVQFGETDSYSPTGTQKRICQELIDAGADVVIGSQAHQAQEIALYKGRPVFYGLGNFLFDQIHRKGVRQAFFLECYIYKGRIIQYHPVYTFMSNNRIPTPATPEQAAEIRSAILRPENF